MELNINLEGKGFLAQMGISESRGKELMSKLEKVLHNLHNKGIIKSKAKSAELIASICDTKEELCYAIMIYGILMGERQSPPVTIAIVSKNSQDLSKIYQSPY